MALIYMKFPEGRAKALTFSYDDGVVQDKRLIKIFDKYGLKATFNLNSKVLYDGKGKNVPDWWNPLTLEEAKALYINSGHEVALHTHTHPYPHIIHSDNMAREVILNREILEREFGGVITGMAYPMGSYTEETINVLKTCGVSYSRTVQSTSGFAYPPENWLALKPTCHHNHEKIFELAEKFISLNWSTASVNAMFYIWGHSYEFDQDNSWERMEKLCEALSGKDDIWYATNIEIYNYQKAFNALEISLDGNTIHNPTSTDVWVRVNATMWDGETICIKAGTTYSK